MKRYLFASLAACVLAAPSWATGYHAFRSSFTFGHGYAAPAVVVQPVVSQVVAGCGQAGAQSLVVPTIAPLQGAYSQAVTGGTCTAAVSAPVVGAAYSAPLTQAVVGSTYGYGGVASVVGGGYGYGTNLAVRVNPFVRHRFVTTQAVVVRRPGAVNAAGRFLFGPRTAAVRVRVR